MVLRFNSDSREISFRTDDYPSREAGQLLPIGVKQVYRIRAISSNISRPELRLDLVDDILYLQLALQRDKESLHPALRLVRWLFFRLGYFLSLFWLIYLGLRLR